MDYEFLIRPEARTDLLDVFHWYQEQRTGLGFDFKLCVDKVFSKLQKHITPPFIKKCITILDERLPKDFRLACFI